MQHIPPRRCVLWDRQVVRIHDDHARLPRVGRLRTPHRRVVLLGDEFADSTYWDFQLASGSEFGQGVFRLVAESPGFAEVEGATLSQFDGSSTNATAGTDDDLNRATDRWEACIPWEWLFANGYGSVTSCTVAIPA